MSLFSARFNGQEIPYSDDELLASIRPLLNLVNARYVITPKSLALQSEHFPEVFSQEKTLQRIKRCFYLQQKNLQLKKFSQLVKN